MTQSIARSIFCGALVFALVLGSTNEARSDLVIDLSPTIDGGTLISINGSGTTGPEIGATANFDNFSGSPFASSILGTGDGSDFYLDGTMTLTNNAFSTGIRLDNNGMGASDFDLHASRSLTMQPFNAFGTARLFTDPGFATPLLYSNFNPGSYVSTSNDAGSGGFGTVTLNIAPNLTAIPEPGTFLFGGIATTLVGVVYGTAAVRKKLAGNPQ